MIAAINPSKTLQKPLEAILKPSKGFSLSVAHQRARTQSRGSTLTACGRATLDGVKRHPHPRGCSSLELLPLAPPRIGNGAKPRIWVKGRVPCGVQGRSPLPCRAQVISNPLRYGVTCYTTFVNQAAVIALLSRQPIYSLSPPPESRVARPQAVSVLPLDSAPAFFSFFIVIQQSSFPLGIKGALTDTLRMSYQCFASWNSEAFTGTNVAGASYSSFKISSSGTLRVSFVDGADIYKGNIVYRPMATIYYGI